MYSYAAFQLFISSELHFPELSAVPLPTNAEPICIKFGEISPVGLANPRYKSLFSQINETELWLHIPDVAYFLVSNGNQILINPAPEAPIKEMQ